MPSLFRNTFYTSLSQGWQMVMALILFKAATTGLGESRFGMYNIATTVMYFVLLFDDFGVNTFITRDIARDKGRSRRLTDLALGLKMLLVPVSLIFIAVFSLVTRNHYDTETRHVIWIFCLYGLIVSFTQLAFGVFRAHERMEYESLVAVTEKTISTGLCVLAITAALGMVPFSLCFVLAGALALALAFGILRRRVHSFTPRIDLRKNAALFKAAFVYGCALFITSLYDKVATLFLFWMQSLSAVGFYNAAQKLLSFTNLLPIIFATAFFPRFAATAHDRDELSRVFTVGLKHLLMLAIPLVPGVFLLSDRLILVLADARFAASAGVIRILAFPAGILFVNIFWASLCGATGHQRTILGFQLAGLTCNVLLNLALIPRYSYLGAAWTTLATEGLVCCMASVFAFTRVVRITEWFFIPKILFAAAVMAAFLIRVPGWPLVPTVIAAVALYGGILLATRTLRLDQLKSQLAGLK
jgi:O-antigen/teichoic acid export membrane protein